MTSIGVTTATASVTPAERPAVEYISRLFKFLGKSRSLEYEEGGDSQLL